MNKHYTKKIIRTYMVVILIMIVPMTACKKYVDIKASDNIKLVETIEDCQKLLNNYGALNKRYPNDGEASSDNYFIIDEDYEGHWSLNDEERSIYRWAPDALRIESDVQWRDPYNNVYIANLVLENVERLKSTRDQTIINDIRGQALFFRAFSFWQLAQIYAKPYDAADNQSPGIPLRFESDFNEKSDRGTVKGTYDQILKDLQEALSLLPSTSVVASRPNKGSTYAMLARVYLSMNDYSNSLTNSSQALQLNSNLMDFNDIPQDSDTPFERFNEEVIFQAVMTGGALLVPNSAFDNLAKIDSNLVKSYAPNDLRSSIFVKLNDPFTSAVGTYRFTGNYDPNTGSELFIGLAVDEMYLTRAECYARAGNANAALADLNTLLRTRWVAGTYVDFAGLSASQALELILTERRKELLMRGLRWTDLRRLNKESQFQTTLTKVIQGVTYTLPPNDNRYTLLIPKEVITNTGMVQNPR